MGVVQIKPDNAMGRRCCKYENHFTNGGVAGPGMVGAAQNYVFLLR